MFKARSKKGVDNDIFWAKIGSGFGKPSSTRPSPRFKLFFFVFNIFSFVWFLFVVGGGVFVCLFF